MKDKQKFTVKQVVAYLGERDIKVSKNAIQYLLNNYPAIYPFTTDGYKRYLSQSTLDKLLLYYKTKNRKN